MEHALCPICGRDDSAPVLRTHDRLFGDVARREEFTIVRCRSCSGAYVDPRPTPEEIGRHYPGAYYVRESKPQAIGAAETSRAAPSRWTRQRGAFLFRHFHGYRGESNGTPSASSEPGPLDQMLFACWRPWLEFGKNTRRLVPFRAGGRVLDVGCGRGAQLALFREMGWETVGVDVSDEAARQAEAKGIPVVLGDLLTVDLPRASFDLVIMTHSLEHLHAPGPTLDRIRELLRPGGVVQVTVPNFASLGARAFGPYWYSLELPRHLTHFTPRTLREILVRRGFEVVRLRHYQTRGTLRGSLKYLLGERRNPAARLLAASKALQRIWCLGLRLIHEADEIVAYARRIR